jgi:hypothetical protein
MDSSELGAQKSMSLVQTLLDCGDGRDYLVHSGNPLSKH